MENFSKWLSDHFGAGVYSVLGHRKGRGRWYTIFNGSVNGYQYEIKRGGHTEGVGV